MDDGYTTYAGLSYISKSQSKLGAELFHKYKPEFYKELLAIAAMDGVRYKIENNEIVAVKFRYGETVYREIDIKTGKDTWDIGNEKRYTQNI